MIGAISFCYPQIFCINLIAVLFALGAEAWRCCQYTATLRSYQRSNYVRALLSSSLSLSCIWFQGFFVLSGYSLPQAGGWLVMVVGLIKFLLGQKWSMEEAKRWAIFGKEGVLTSPLPDNKLASRLGPLSPSLSLSCTSLSLWVLLPYSFSQQIQSLFWSKREHGIVAAS
jgi:hypothetical protein